VTQSRRIMLAIAVCASALTAAAAAGCSSSGTAPGEGGTSGHRLTKTQFIASMNSTCSSLLSKVKAIPAPTSADDFADLLKLDGFIDTAEPAFQKTAAAIVDRSPDSAALHKNWLDIDAADFKAQLPFLLKFDAAAKARDATELSTLVKQSASVPDHSAAEATYLTGYGLKDCAALADY
jgi:hypothetical protein